MPTRMTNIKKRLTANTVVPYDRVPPQGMHSAEMHAVVQVF